MGNDGVQYDRYGEEIDDSDYVGEVTTLYKKDDVAHEEEPKEKLEEMRGWTT